MKAFQIGSYVLVKMIFTWQELAAADAEVTAAMIDDVTCCSHKITPDPFPRKPNRKLYSLLESCYSLALKTVSFWPLQHGYDRYSNCTSFGVLSKVFLVGKTLIDGLVGFLAPISESEIIEEVNDFSIF